MVLPAGVLPKRLASCARAGGVAFTDGVGALYFISVAPQAAGAGAGSGGSSSSGAAAASASASAAEYSLHLHGPIAVGGGAGEAGGLGRLALWVEPSSSQLYAAVAARGDRAGLLKLLRVALPAVPPGGGGGGAGEAASAQCVRTVTMHNPIRKADEEGWVSGLALWEHPASGALLALTVGSDAELAVATLHDGSALLPSQGGDPYGPERSWHCTSNGSGGSKGYPYAPAQFVAAAPGVGVAFTGSQFEPVAHLWDVLTPKASPTGKLLVKTPKLADYCRGPGKVLLMTCAFAPSGRVLAYTNSNDADDATLKLVWPVGK